MYDCMTIISLSIYPPKETMLSIRKKRLSDEVINEINRMIRSGELEVGDKLPNQIEFASQLGVSRTSLREALNMLAMVGAVKQKQGVGTILVSKLNAINIHDFSPPLMSDSNAALELIEARDIIEVGAAKLAAVNATKGQVDNLDNIVKSMIIALDNNDSQTYIELDIKFHMSVAECSNNRFIIYSYKNIQGYTEQYIQECLNMIPNMQISSMKFHRKISDAIKHGDEKRSVAEMKKHILEIKKMYKIYCTQKLKK